MKLLSDFDGVWTDPSAEARAQGEVLDGALLDWTPPSERAAASAWIARARGASLADPRRYGWAPGGGPLSAFADEDPFAPHSALLHYIHQHRGSDRMAAALSAAATAHGHASLDGLGGWAHAQGVQRVVDVRGPGILEAAAAAGRRALEHGVEIVVVSNSGADKLARWFTHVRVSHRTHPERESGALTLRGGARKFELDPSAPAPRELGDVEVETARPHYERILREERPDAVVGDVFSLDLALPLALKRREKDWGGLRLFWLIHPYTPAWLRATLERHAGGEVEAVEGGLSSVVDRLAGC